MTRVRAGALLLVAAVTVGLAAWLVANTRWVTEVIDDGFDVNARANPYLAAERFLERHGTDTEYRIQRGAGLELPPPGYALLLIDSELGLSQPVAARVTAWVHGGGHLLVDAEQVFGARAGDFWLQGLGFELRVAPPPAAGRPAAGRLPAEVGEPLATTTDAGADCGRDTVAVWSSPVAGAAGGTEAVIGRVELAAGSRFVDWPGEERVLAGDADGAWLVQVPFGAGAITALAGTQPFVNGAIHCHDHAFLLARLLAGQRGAWLVRHVAVAHWLELLWADGWPLVKTAAIVLLLLLWAGARTFGPRSERGAGSRRGLALHLRASGEWLWRHGATALLLRDLRAGIERRIDWRAQPASGAALPSARVARALTAAPRTEAELIGIVRTLKELQQSP